MSVVARRAYDLPSARDGRRYLIDRLWPRGLGREQLRLDAWLKELAPSPELRTWFGHDPAKYPDFRSRFRKELAPHSALILRLAREARAGTVTLVFGARDPEHCNATVLKELIEEHLPAAYAKASSRQARAPGPSERRSSR